MSHYDEATGRITPTPMYLVPNCEVRASYSCPQEGCTWQAVVGRTPRSRGTFRCPTHGHEPAPDCEIMAGLNLEVRNTTLQLELDRATRREQELVKKVDGLETSVRRQRDELGEVHRNLKYAQQDRGRIRDERNAAIKMRELAEEDRTALEEVMGTNPTALVEHLQVELAKTREERDSLMLELKGLQQRRVDECSEDVQRVRERGERLTALAVRTCVALFMVTMLAGVGALVRLAFFGG